MSEKFEKKMEEDLKEIEFFEEGTREKLAPKKKMLRKLKTSDVFKMSKILKKMGLKKELDLKDKSQMEIGVELFVTVFENLYRAEEEVNIFLADMSGMKKEEFDELEIDKIMEIIAEFKDMIGMKSFLGAAS